MSNRPMEPTDAKPLNASPVAAPARWKKAAFLYLATWLSTTGIGALTYGGGTLVGGLLFSVPLMTILTLHELGHYWQTRRYRISASLPYFIPFPLPPFGTMGAVIRMSGRIPNVKALFDVGVSGPLAGLAATLAFLFVGLALSEQVETSTVVQNGALSFGEPLLFRWASELFFDRSDPASTLTIHPIAAAAWVGLFLTSINLAPLGQLDGGHILYALLRRRAGYCSVALFGAAVLGVAIFRRWNWVAMLILIAIFGVDHPETRDDAVPLGRFRTILGWATLAFVLIGFTPNPIDVVEVDEPSAVETRVERDAESKPESNANESINEPKKIGRTLASERNAAYNIDVGARRRVRRERVESDV